MVNNEWVHNDYNPLWEALRHNQQVTAVVMRRGLPIVYEYNIKLETVSKSQADTFVNSVCYK